LLAIAIQALVAAPAAISPLPKDTGHEPPTREQAAQKTCIT